jgi:HEPN domain-containing protein/predicted nucleotidyltransferase
METVTSKNEALNDHLSAFVRNPLRPLIEKMAARIAEEYRPEQIILYGSQVTGKARPDSDIDLFVVKQAQESFFIRCATVKRIVRDLYNKTPVSPIVLTPEEVQKRLDHGDQFIQQIFDEGIRLYPNPNRRLHPSRSDPATLLGETVWATTNFHNYHLPHTGGLNMALKAEDSLYPQDWLRFAEQDWQRVEKRLSEDDHQDAAVHLQQALEKYLKAFLLANGWKLEKTHEVSKLLEKAIKYKPALNTFAGLCEQVENYYFAERYPLSLDAGTSADEIAKNFQEAHQLREIILATFSKPSEAPAQLNQRNEKTTRKPRQTNKTKRSRKSR